MKSFALTIGLFASMIACIAQESWLQPNKFHCNNGERLGISFLAGKDFIGQPSLANAQVADFKLHEISAVSDLLDSVRADPGEGLKYTVKAEGTYLFSLQSNSILHEFTADIFNMMLKDYELDAVRNLRQKSNVVNAPARVNQQLFEKLLIQVGHKRDETYKKVIGWPVEIIPDRNPMWLKVGDQVRFRILFDNKPIFGVRAKVWNRYDNRTTLQNIYTQQDGTIEVRISSPGPWMVTVMKMIPSREPGVDWHSYQGSFVFGFD